MEDSVILYAREYKKFLRDLRGSFTALNFPWKLGFSEIEEEPGEQPQEVEIPPLPTQEEILQSSRRLMESGSYEDALKLLEKVMKENPSNQEAARLTGSVKNWIRMKVEAEEKRKHRQYETAKDIMEKLSMDVPPGDGKEQLILRLTELKKEWEKELESLQGKLKETKDPQAKIEIIEELIEISPAHRIEELTREKERYLKRVVQQKRAKERKNIVYKAAVMAAAIIAIIALIYILMIAPEAKYKKEINYIKIIINTDPGNALDLIEKLQRKRDNEEIRRLKEKAVYNIKINESEIIIQKAVNYANQNDFQQALTVFSKIREEIFKGIPIPEDIKQKEDELKTRASGYYLNIARAETNPGEKFINYDTANRYAPNDAALSEEMNNFLDRQTVSILGSLLRKAEYETNCPTALKLIDLCLKVKATDSRVLALRERIHERCK